METVIVKRAWLWSLVIGVGLFFGADTALQLTDNPNLFPTVIMLGTFVIPVAYVLFFYQHVRDRNIPFLVLGGCFLVGGALGIIAAGLLEWATLREANLLAFFGVGFIEEITKLIFPVALFLGWRYRHQADGLLFGITAGMGFAALETMGYGVTALIDTNGDVRAVEQILLIRGLLSPLGHAAWTGIICGVLWSQRAKFGRITINLKVIAAFIFVVVLHTAWNIVSLFGLFNAIAYSGMLIVGGASLGTLLLLYRGARRVPAVPVALEGLIELAPMTEISPAPVAVAVENLAI
jgi:RsiW-degrading membrane proteinase PrsW (M82 family)